jgi:cysteine desulfurase/selenocysteine lyase
VRPAAQSTPTFDIERVRADFPILRQRPHGKRLCYLDSAASAQQPESVIETVAQYHRESHANVHRGVHYLSQHATERLEAARRRVRDFLGAASEQEIIFTRGTTESINLVAQTWGRSQLRPGDEILLTTLEHHANIVPWQMLAAETGAIIKVAPIDAAGAVPLETFKQRLSPRTRLAAFTHVSNALGTVLPVEGLTLAAQAVGARVLIDGAQAAPHLNIDVRKIGCDFYAFSSHKAYGPTGTGVLWGRRELLDAMPPWQGGGDMIRSVSFAGTTYNDLPHKFEAGTPNISGILGLAAALDYITAVHSSDLHAHEQRLLRDATAALESISGLRVVGSAANKIAVISFVMDGIHPHDLGTILDTEGVAVRTGHHCAMPLMEHLGLAATARASFACYSNDDDVTQLIAALHKAREVFG